MFRQSKMMSPVSTLVVLSPFIGWLLAQCAAAWAVQCNTQVFDNDTNAVCSRDYDVNIQCSARKDAAACIKSLGSLNFPANAATWRRGCRAGGNAWDDCVVNDGNCLKKYYCAWNGISCGTATSYSPEAWWTTPKAVSRTCDPVGG
jgi:hypothetical protein